MSHDIHFVLGGARSGKSRIAENLALDHFKALSSNDTQLFYFATAQAFDDEMQARIDLHQQRRGSDWNLIEAPVDLADKMREVVRLNAAERVKFGLRARGIAEQKFDEAFVVDQYLSEIKAIE